MALIDLVHQFNAAADAHDLDVIDRMCTPDIVVVTPVARFEGAKDYKRFAEQMYAGFSDLQHHVLRHVEMGDTIAFELEITGTHDGVLVGPVGSLEPTGKAIKIRGADFWRFEGDRIASSTVYFDQAQWAEQLRDLRPTG